METQSAFNLIVDQIRDSIAQGRKHGGRQDGGAFQIAAKS
jgi:hypothetical protein